MHYAYPIMQFAWRRVPLRGRISMEPEHMERKGSIVEEQMGVLQWNCDRGPYL